MSENNIKKPEFSHIVNVDNIANKGVHLKLKPNSDELTKLASRFNLLSLNNFNIKLHVKPVSAGNKILVNGHIKADIIQSCIINLSQVSSKIDEEFQLNFITVNYDSIGNKDDLEISLNDDYDIIEDNMIDIGEVAAQQLSLIIDPYPRSDNADLKFFTDEIFADKKKTFTIDDKFSPFDILSKLDKKS